MSTDVAASSFPAGWCLQFRCAWPSPPTRGRPAGRVDVDSLVHPQLDGLREDADVDLTLVCSDGGPNWQEADDDVAGSPTADDLMSVLT